MKIYSAYRQYPDKLPERLRLSNGSTRTDSNTFTPEEIEDAGYVGPIMEPFYDSSTEQLTWDGQQFNVTSIPPILVTAENAVSRYFSPYQIAALSRLEMALMQAGTPLGPAMTAAKTWLESVMLGWAVDPTSKPASVYGVPNVTFEQASAEAVSSLNPES